MVDYFLGTLIFNHMVDTQHNLDAVFKALGDPTRRAMLEALSGGPATIGRLAAPHDMSLAGASKHVRVLEEAGLVRCERRGRERICAIAPAPLRDAERWLESHVAIWSDRLDALAAVLAEDDNKKD